MNELPKPAADPRSAQHRPADPLAVVGVSACRKLLDTHFPGHWTAERYMSAIADASRCVPIQIPALGGTSLTDQQLHGLLQRLDGLMLTGSPSNVEPHHYDGPASVEGTAHDPHRDATTLPLIRMAVRDGVPILAICRGIQELNVALGGTLHQRLWEVPGRFDHRSDKSKPPIERYEPAHAVSLRKGGPLAKLAGADEIRVNSLHAQAIDRLAPALQAEAQAEDGTIEAVSVRSARTFAIGVQWHAEWRSTEDPLSRALFTAFGDACRQRARARQAAGVHAA
ncbi:MAG: gamma-glutamyl-gamma-aminobutyrate hydrolase family protein [Rhodospirillaceae bacterium]|nr:gamma-glutamyl-gamma-aminobutyrate hydrolase family protein [Rhodospirillaceae bacterium]